MIWHQRIGLTEMNEEARIFFASCWSEYASTIGQSGKSVRGGSNLTSALHRLQLHWREEAIWEQKNKSSFTARKRDTELCKKSGGRGTATCTEQGVHHSQRKDMYCFCAVCASTCKRWWWWARGGGGQLQQSIQWMSRERILNAKTCYSRHLERHLNAILSLLLSRGNKMRFHWKTKAATVTQTGHANRKNKMRWIQFLHTFTTLTQQ